MAWLRGKVAIGNFPDLAGAVNKISESVKNFEKNFENTSNVDSTQSWSPEFMAFVGQNDGKNTAESSKTHESSKRLNASEGNDFSEKQDESSKKDVESSNHSSFSKGKEEADACDSTKSTTQETLTSEERQDLPVKTNKGIHLEGDNSAGKHVDTNNVADGVGETLEESKDIAEKSVETNIETTHLEADSQAKPSSDDVEESKIETIKISGSIKDESGNFVDQVGTSTIELNEDMVIAQEDSANKKANVSVEEGQSQLLPNSDDASETRYDIVSKDEKENENAKVHSGKEEHKSSGSNLSENADSTVELRKLKKEVKNMENSLLGAARQAQAKADEIAKLMNENEQLKSEMVDKRKSNEAEIEALREEYHQRVSTMERKVYALTRERDTLRREQNKRSDVAELLKEKDEIITQVMAEGENLSKKQAVQESIIRKLRAQIREFEDEKKALLSKLQTEENKVESLKREKAVSEKLQQEALDKKQNELETQKEHYTNALNAAKEANKVAESRANDEARNELESHLREAEERETLLVQTLEELRQTLSRKEHQAVSREDMLWKEIVDLQKRYHASERRCEELVMQVPESTRPLLRQIEAMQETTARKAEDFAAVERSLNIRLQDAEAKVEAAEERDRSVNKRLSQTQSRVNVLEAQISCLRFEQTQLTKSLEKERQRASESRQEFLALKEEADTHKGHVNLVKEEMIELKRKHKRELQEILTQRELLQQDMEREKAARLELEKTPRLHVPTAPKPKSPSENGLTRRLSSASSLSSMEESFFLQASLDSSQTFSERSPQGPILSSYYLKSMTPHALQAALRQKEGELASYMSRLASMETIRDSLSEELVEMTEECEKLRSEVALLPSIKAELEALRVRHSAALELMGERDEELEELRADIVDLKEMYREQVTMLVNKIQNGSSIEFA